MGLLDWLTGPDDTAAQPSAGPLLAPEPQPGVGPDMSPLLAGLGQGNGDAWGRVQPMIQALSLALLTHQDRRNPLGTLGQILPGVMAQAQNTQRQAAFDKLAPGLMSAPDFTGGSGAAAAGGAGASNGLAKALAPTKTSDAGEGGSSLPIGSDSLDKVIRTVYGEAAGEGPTGQAAVAAVIANRAKQSGMDPADVVLAKNQFEPWGNPAARRRMLDLNPDSDKYQAIKAAVLPVLSGDAPDPTNGATHFYAPKAQAALGRNAPSWDNGSGVDIGNHRFFALGYGGGGKDGIQRRADLPARGARNTGLTVTGNNDDPELGFFIPPSPDRSSTSGDPGLPAPALPGPLGADLASPKPAFTAPASPLLTGLGRDAPTDPGARALPRLLSALGGDINLPSPGAPGPLGRELQPAAPPAASPLLTAAMDRAPTDAGSRQAPALQTALGRGVDVSMPGLPGPLTGMPSGPYSPSVSPLLASAMGQGTPADRTASSAPAPELLTALTSQRSAGTAPASQNPVLAAIMGPNIPTGPLDNVPVPPRRPDNIDARPVDVSGVPNPPGKTHVERAEPATGAPTAIAARPRPAARPQAVSAQPPTVAGRPVAPQRMAELPDYSNSPDGGMRAFLTDPGNRMPNGVPAPRNATYVSMPGQPTVTRQQTAPVVPIAGSTAAARVAQNATINAPDDRRPAYERPVGDEPGAFRPAPDGRVQVAQNSAGRPVVTDADPLVPVPGINGGRPINRAWVDAQPDGADVPDDSVLEAAQRKAGGSAPASPAAALTAPSAASQAGKLPDAPQQIPGAPAPPNPNYKGATAKAAAMNYAKQMTAYQIAGARMGGEQGKMVFELAKQNIERYADPYMKPSDHMKLAQEIVDAQDPRVRTMLQNSMPNNQPTSTREYEFYSQQEQAGGRAPKSYNDWDLARRREENDKGEDAFSADLGKARAKRADVTESALTDAPNQIAKLNLAQNMLAKATTGKLAPVHSTVVGFAQALGATPEQIKGLGLNPNQNITDDAAQKIVNELTVGAIGKGGFPSNNFSDADRAFLSKIFPSLTNRPEANGIAIDVLKAVQQRRIDAANAWGAYQDSEEAAGRTANYAKWERSFAKEMAGKPDLFSDAQKRIDALPGSGPGAGVSTSVPKTVVQPRPEASSAAGRTVNTLADVPEGASYRTDAGNVYRKLNGKAVFVRKEKP